MTYPKHEVFDLDMLRHLPSARSSDRLRSRTTTCVGNINVGTGRDSSLFAAAASEAAEVQHSTLTPIGCGSTLFDSTVLSNARTWDRGDQ